MDLAWELKELYTMRAMVIIEIGQNILMSHGDQRRLIVTQISCERPPAKEYNNNSNNNNNNYKRETKYLVITEQIRLNFALAPTHIFFIDPLLVSG